MLGTEKSFQLLRENYSQVFGDGTFKFDPKGYLQMYTIHIYKHNKYIQVAYFLLKDKHFKTYNTMCKMLHGICPELNRSVFQLDFWARSPQGSEKAVSWRCGAGMPVLPCAVVEPADPATWPAEDLYCSKVAGSHLAKNSFWTTLIRTCKCSTLLQWYLSSASTNNWSIHIVFKIPDWNLHKAWCNVPPYHVGRCSRSKIPTHNKRVWKFPPTFWIWNTEPTPQHLWLAECSCMSPQAEHDQE